MFYVLIIFLSSRAFCCEIVERFNYKIVYYNDKETLNMTITDGSYPADIEVTSITGSCPNMVTKLLPDQYFDDIFKKYKHVKQIKVPMSQSLSECTYYVTMRSRSLCLVRAVAVLRLQPRAAGGGRCDLTAHIDWAQEISAKYAADQQSFLCDVENVMCEERSATPPTLSSTVFTYTESSNHINSRTIQIRLKNGDISRNESTFVCQAQANMFAVKGRLMRNNSDFLRVDVYYNVDDEYNATCDGSNEHWVLQTDDLYESVGNKTFSKKLRKDDDKTKLICVEITCDDFERHQTCYLKILNEITFHLNSAESFYLALASAATISLLVVVACAWCRCQRSRAARGGARRPRLPTPPPPPPPRTQLYYSVPFERPIPGPRLN